MTGSPPPADPEDTPLHPETETLVAELDAAVQAHMDWTRRILRCAMLRTKPDDDVLDPLAHTLCRFGAWLARNHKHLESFDAAAAARIDTAHRAMHDAMRTICLCIVHGETAQAAELDAFEQSQAELIRLLATFKTLILSTAVRRDPLTQLPLRHNIESDYLLYQKEARRRRSALYVVMIDVDNFKPINDNYGHPAGDQVLRHVADTLKRTLRSDEPLYRYGGEEFLWLLKCAAADEAGRSAERVRETVAATPVPVDGTHTLHLTITLGLARVGAGEALTSAIRRADLALYEGKRRGRNRYVIADD